MSKASAKVIIPRRSLEEIKQLGRLENNITQLAAHINAATYQLLELIREYDECEGWAAHTLASCAHWLQWQCGTNLGTAREKVRVARALPELPQISAAFSEGRLSYSKVRAMTRVATPRNEDHLLNIALHGTAAHVERTVSNYRRYQRWEMLVEDNRRHAARELNWYTDEDGMLVFKGRFSPEQGVLIRQSLEKAMNALFGEQVREHPYVSAETPKGVGLAYEQPDAIATRRADALERVAESFLAGQEGDASGGDRYLVNIHTEAEVLTQDGEGAESECGDHCHVSAETSRRMSCDASVVHWRENSEGEPLNIGRKTRSIPPAIRRALSRRDGGCRFPGCSCRKFVDAHHIVHWADGGETKLSNLVLLCRRHHRMVHEGGFGVHTEPGGEIWFSYPTKEIFPPNADGRFRGNALLIKVRNADNGLDINPHTLPPNWCGEVMDYDLAQLGMEQLE